MPHISKRRKAFAGKVDTAKSYAAIDAMKLIKETATAKFDEAAEVSRQVDRQFPDRPGLQRTRSVLTVQLVVPSHVQGPGLFAQQVSAAQALGRLLVQHAGHAGHPDPAQHEEPLHGHVRFAHGDVRERAGR